MNILNIKSSKRRPTAADRGVIYITDSHAFPGLQISATSHDAPTCVIDIGMTHEQLQWCELNNIRIQPYTDTIPDTHMWQTWIKPLALKLSPFETTLYIDTDSIICNDLSHVFDVIEQRGVLVVKDEGKYIQEPNITKYQAKYGPSESYIDNYVNAGVIGYTGDYKWFIEQYADTCMQCFNQNEFDVFSWYDEGCLNRCLDLNDRVQACDDYRYNRLSPVIPCLTKHKLLIPDVEANVHKKYNYLMSFTSYKSFMRNENINNNNYILHFRGTSKPWNHWL